MGIEAQTVAIEEEITINPGNRVVPPLPEDIKTVGQFIRTAMKNLSDSGFVFTDEEIENLCSIKWYQEHLGTGKMVPFAKLHIEGETNEHRIGKENVYIKALYSYGKNSILIKSDLFNYNRETFVKWYRSLATKEI